MNSSHWKTISIRLAMVLALSAPSVLLADNAALEYAGAYSGDVVWQGTVTLAADVLILKGGSLTIHAGTQVNVVPAEGTKIDPEYLSSQTELLIRGKLDIQGTAEAPVRFFIVETSDSETIAWAGITLDKAVESHLVNLELERADIAVRCVESSPEIRAVRIAHSRYGIVAQQQSHPKILGNVLSSGEGGIFCLRGSNPYLLDNQITGHDEEAVFVDASSRPRLDRNAISGNSIGLALYPRDLPFDSIGITNNLENVRWLGHQGQGDAR